MYVPWVQNVFDPFLYSTKHTHTNSQKYRKKMNLFFLSFNWESFFLDLKKGLKIESQIFETDPTSEPRQFNVLLTFLEANGLQRDEYRLDMERDGGE